MNNINLIIRMAKTKVSWNHIIDGINNQKTILFLGPGIFVNFENSNRENSFFQNLLNEHPDEIISYNQNDGFLVFKDQYSCNYISSEKIKPFYKEGFKNPVLYKLVEIPFHLIISVTPDITLSQIFRELEFDFFSGNYKTANGLITDTPSKEKPLIYNLLGEAEGGTSIFSYDDLFNFIKTIYKDKYLPDQITSAFNEDKTTNIIFLGFDFEKWHFRLILNLLGIKIGTCIRYSSAQNDLKIEFQTLYEAHFDIKFIENDIQSFVDTLYEKFKEYTPKIEFRKSKEKKTNKYFLKENIRKLLKEAYNSIDFETLCITGFPNSCIYDDVYKNFTNQDQEKRINMLLDKVIANNLYEELLSEVKKHNPYQFENFKPYYDEK